MDYEIVSATELDSHADSPIVGRYCHIFEHKPETANVSGFSNELGQAVQVPIVTAGVAYDCEYTGNTHIMVIHNALYFKDMEVNLIY